MRVRTLHLMSVTVVICGVLAAGSGRGVRDLAGGLGIGVGASNISTESEPTSPGADWLTSQRGNRSGYIAPADYLRALEQMRLAASRTVDQRPDLAAPEWESMGPTNIGGRVTDVAVDPLLPDTAYAATASGGVWKTTDAGLTWLTSWPEDITQATGAIAAGADGVLYVGTGESNPGGGSLTYGGTGIYRSTDHGATWDPLGLQTSGAFGRIVVDPRDPTRIFAAAAGNLYRPGGERGLYRSDDGGETWNLVLQAENDTTGAIDIAMDPQEPDRLLVAMWDHRRFASHRHYAGDGSGVWRTSDGGSSWGEVVLPHGVDPAVVGRIGLSFAPSDPSRAYAVISNQLNGTPIGFFRSNDGGATFARTAVDGTGLGQSNMGSWFGRTWVDPADEDHVFLAGVGLMASTDAGNSFENVDNGTPNGPLPASYVVKEDLNLHPDQHAMAWDPKAPGRIYLGNDGGMYHSSNSGGTWTRALSQGWTQHYSVDVGELDPDLIVTGLQDNHCQKNWIGPVTGKDLWNPFGLCGDGLQTLINPAHQQTLYACGQNGGCVIAPTGSVVGVSLVRSGERPGWQTPMVFDPSDPMTMYWGLEVLNRSTDGGITWAGISGDLSKNETQLDPNSAYRFRGVVSTIGVAASNSDIVWVGTDDGLLWKTTNATAGTLLSEMSVTPKVQWTLVSDPALPDGWITRVAIDPADSSVVYATYSGYRGGDDSAHVMRTIDGGETWARISDGLPDAPVNDIEVVGERLIVASDVGVFISEDFGDSWFKLGSGMPAVPVTDMRYHEGTSTLTVATFGHGVRRLALP